MKNHVLSVGLLLMVSCASSVFAQNKTLGVGVATPNPNAVLHVESPSANQGFIMPRLTTGQRTSPGFTSILTGADNGLMVYDTDIKNIFIWDGAKWNSSAQVAGGPKLVYPYKDSITLATGTPDLFALKYNNAENKRVLRIENLNPTNASSALSVSNLGPGIAGYFQVNNPATASSTLYATTNSNAGGAVAPVAVYGESTGTGSLGASFRINNAANTYPAIFSETTGLGNTASFHVNNAANTLPALFVTTNGTGAAVAGETATGFSAVVGKATGGFSNGVSGISNSSDPGSFAVLGQNSGAGPAGVFTISNVANTSHALHASTNGSGAALLAENLGAGNGFAGLFSNTNGSNTFPAIQASTQGIGPAIAVFQTTGPGGGVNVHMQNTANTVAGIMVEQLGMGSGAQFNINNITNNSPSISASTNGTSEALRANTSGTQSAALFATNNTENTAPTINVMTNGNGSAGNFSVTSGGNTTSAVYATTSGTGSAIQAQTASGFTAIFAQQDGSTGGHAGLFDVTNAGNSSPAIQAHTVGSGSAGNFEINNGASSAPALFAQTNGSGPAFSGDNTGNGNVIFIQKTGSTGGAGHFRINNAANTTAAVYANTNSTDGYAIEAGNTANGRAMSLFNGGMQVSTQVLTGGGNITQRAIAYQVDANTYTFDSGAILFAEGDIFYFFNVGGGNASVNGITIAAGTGMTLIYLGGVLRGF